jgi:2'-hydroxyisoflavone reductase
MAMRILMIGGTRFLGRALVDAALAAGHDVTVFHRGRSPLPPYAREVEHVIGDRDGGLGVLDGRQWDAAFDTCGYFPRIVGASARALADRVAHYTFVSSVSVYSDSATPGADESSATGTIADETVEEITGETYGPLKALCERAAEAAMPGRVLHVRAGLIVGPHDPTDRFTYWIRAARSGRRFLAPEPRSGPLQVIDARDIADFAVRMAEQRRAGIYDTIGDTVRDLVAWDASRGNAPLEGGLAPEREAELLAALG